MIHRHLGHSGLRVPVLSFGTAGFGGGDAFFKGFGSTDAGGASRLVDICLDNGISMFDSADVYSDGAAERLLGEAIKGKRNHLLISTKATLPISDRPNDYGSSREHLIRSVEKALLRLGTDHIDLFQLHGQDFNTPVEETLATLHQLVREGKIRYTGASNFSAWHVMKSIACSDRYGYPRYVAHQVYYSLLNRDYEWELLQVAQDQGVGAVVWSPLGWGKLTGKIRRGKPASPGMRAHDIAGTGPQYDEERLFRIIDAMDLISAEIGKSVTQIALNWLVNQPTVATLIIGARDEEQLLQNIGAVGWELSEQDRTRLDAASAIAAPYPVWHQRDFPMLNEKQSPA